MWHWMIGSDKLDMTELRFSGEDEDFDAAG